MNTGLSGLFTTPSAPKLPPPSLGCCVLLPGACLGQDPRWHSCSLPVQAILTPHQSRQPICLPHFSWDSETTASCPPSKFSHCRLLRRSYWWLFLTMIKGKDGPPLPISMGEGVGFIHSKPTSLCKNALFLISNFRPYILLSRVKHLRVTKLISSHFSSHTHFFFLILCGGLALILDSAIFIVFSLR